METDDKVYRDWIEWFYANADFGPAHSDVMIMMMDDFEEETGKSLPDYVKEGY
jgi:hypothetical protein